MSDSAQGRVLLYYLDCVAYIYRFGEIGHVGVQLTFHTATILGLHD